MSLRDEMVRKEKENKKKIRIFIYICILIGVVICFFNIIIGMLIVIPLILLIATVQTVTDINHEAQDFDGKIKHEISPKIIKAVIPDAERYIEEGISKEEYLASELTDFCEEFVSNDKIILPLTLEDAKVNEIELFYVSHKIAAEQKDKFYGIFAKLHLSRDVRTKIKISNEGKYINGVFKYEMDNKAFESVFDVMAMNKNIVGNILTEDVMSFMLQIYKMYGYIVEVSIIRNMLYARVIGKPLLIQTSDGTTIDRNAVDNHYNIMKEVRELVQQLYANIEKLELK